MPTYTQGTVTPAGGGEVGKRPSSSVGKVALLEDARGGGANLAANVKYHRGSRRSSPCHSKTQPLSHPAAVHPPTCNVSIQHPQQGGVLAALARQHRQVPGVCGIGAVAAVQEGKEAHKQG
jgi:hypothetical protein